jgi:hypothetical protein
MTPIKFTVAACDPDNDAPTVDDLLGQLRDFVELLQGMERAVALPGEEAEIEWRVTNARRSSPLAIELTPFPKHHGTNIDRRAGDVRRQAALGLRMLSERRGRPAYFGDDMVRRAEGMFVRVTEGLATTRIDFGDGIPPIDLNRSSAHGATAHAAALRKPDDRPYREQGSVEGHTSGVERDGHGRALLWLRPRRGGEAVKCILYGGALAEVERRQVREVLGRNVRLVVRGTLHFRGLGRLSFVEGHDISFLRDIGHPDVAAIRDVDFTGGQRSEDYLKGLRDGG